MQYNDNGDHIGRLQQLSIAVRGIITGSSILQYLAS